MKFFKKILEIIVFTTIAVLGFLFFVGKITLESNGWFSTRSIQIVFGSLLGVLIISYLTTDRKELSPNQLKALVRKSILSFLAFFFLFFYSVYNTPVTTVTADIKNVAKTTDLVSVKESVLQVNKKVENFSYSTNKTLQEVAVNQKKIADDVKTAIEKIKGEEEASFFDQTNRIKLLQKGVDSIGSTLSLLVLKTNQEKKEKQNQPSAVVVNNNKLYTIGAIAVILMTLWFTSSFFWIEYQQISVSVRRKTIPLFIGLMALFSIPFFVIEDISVLLPFSKKEVVKQSDSLLIKKELEVFKVQLSKEISATIGSGFEKAKKEPAPAVVPKDTATLVLKPPDKKGGKKGEKNAKLKASAGKPLGNKTKVRSSSPRYTKEVHSNQ